MNALAWFEAHGGTLLLGGTIVLAGGLLAMACTRDLRGQRRLGVLTALACVLYAVAALAPLPRLALPDLSSPRIDERTTGVLLPTRRASLEDLLAQAPQPEPVASIEHDAAQPTDAIADPIVAPAAPFPWSLAFAAIWCCAALLAAARLFLGLLRVHWLLRRSQPAPAHLTTALALPKRARVRIADRAVQPFCAGVLRPAIVLSPELAARERLPQALAVLRHEAAHVEARDAAVQLLFALLAVPLALHPLFWLLRARVRFCGEVLADDAAAHPGLHAYVRNLLDLAEGASPALAADTAVPMFRRRSEFYRRIQMLLQRQGPLSKSPSRARTLAQFAFATALAATTAAFCGAPLPAQDPVRSPEQEAALRAEVQSLQREIADLRAMLAKVKQQAPTWDKQGHEAPTEGKPLPLRDIAGAFDVALDDRAVDPSSVKPGETGAFQWRTPYTIQKGDSLQSVLRRLYGRAATDEELRAVQQQNGIDQPNQVRVGQQITLPTPPAKVADPTPQPSEQPKTDANAPQGQDATPGGGKPKGNADPFRNRSGYRGKSLPGTLQPSPLDTPRPDAVASRYSTPLPNSDSLANGDAAPSTTRALAELTTRYLDLQAEIESTELVAAEQQQLAAAGQLSTREARQAVLKHETAKKKFAVVARLLQGEIESTRAELHWVDQQIDALKPGPERARYEAQIIRTKTNLDALLSVGGEPEPKRSPNAK